MKVLAIRGCNLASIEGEFEVDFSSSPLSDCGLFAISGPTGAGKSTLLDALCLALYHNTPRLLMATERDIKIPDAGDQDLSPQDPRNLLRRGCGSGFAEADFVGIDGTAWRARWEVRRARERAEGKLQNASVRLESCDGVTIVAEQQRETAAAIEARVGLSFDQFRRAVLLAQNDFATLLKAKQNERADLLEALTSTEVFSALSRLAHARAAEARREIEQMRQRLEIMPTLSAEARSELEAALSVQQEVVASLEQRRAAIEGERNWHADVQQRQTEVTQAQQALRNMQIDDNEYAQNDAQLQRWSTLLALQANWQQQQDALAAITALDGQISTQGGLIEKVRADVNAKQQALTEAADQLTLATEAKEAAAPRISQARKLDQEIRQAEAQQAGREAELKALDDELAEVMSGLARLGRERGRLVSSINDWKAWQVRHPAFAVADTLWADLGQNLRSLGENRSRRQDLERALREAETAIEQQRQRSRAAQNKLTEARQHEDQLQGRLQAAEVDVTAIGPEAIARERGTWREQQEQAVQAQGRIEALEREEAQLQQLEEAIARLDADKEAKRSQQAEAVKEEALANAELRAAELTRDRAHLAANAHTQRLRAALVEGEPCLVCGATEHPGVEQDHSAAQGLLAELDRQFEAAREDFKQAQQASTRLATQCEGLQAQRTASQQQREATSNRVTDARLKVTEALRDLSLQCSGDIRAAQASAVLATCRTQLKAQADALDAREQALTAAQQQFEEARSGHEQSRKAREQANEQLIALERDLQPLQREEAGHRATLTGHQKSIDNAEQTLTGLGFAPEAGLASAEAMLAIWSEGNKLRQAAVDARAPLAALEANLATSQQARTRAEAKKESLNTTLAEHRGSLKTVREKRAVTLEAEDTEAYDKFLGQQQTEASRARDTRQGEWQIASQAFSEVEAEAKTLAGRRDDRDQQLHRVRAALQQDLAALPASFAPRPSLEDLDILMPAIPEDLPARLQARDERKQALRDAKTVLRTRAEALRALTDAPKSHREQEATQAEWEELRVELKAASEVLQARRIELQRDDEHHAQAAEHQAAIQAKEQAAERWHRLDALIGSASGDKFKRYAQQFTLEILLEYANQHLDRLAPRYQLQRGNENLSLLVVDRDFGDELRSVHSLSGGESFLVALGLALALASLSSERVRVESLFIDEGFGSLDAETLNMVMEALDRLQSEGRRIGVISHVHDMAERIGTQIRVVPTGRGRSRIEVVA